MLEQVSSAAKAKPVFLPLSIFAVLLGGLLSTLNGRLLSVALPDLRGALHLSVDEGAWIATCYSMAIMFIGAFSVYLGGLFGPRRILLFCSAGYAVASLLIPFAASYQALLSLEVLAGLTSGTFYPLTLSFVLLNLPLRIAHIGLATYSMAILFSANIASSVTAWDTGVLSWQWVFWTAACLGPMMFACVYFGIPQTPRPKSQGPRPSWRGLLYWSFGLALIYGALDEGERVHWFGSPNFAALLITGLFLIVMSIVRRNQDPNPLITIPFLRNRSSILLSILLFGFRFFLLATALIIPQFLGSVRGFKDEQIGPVLGLVGLLQFGVAWVVALCLRAVNARLIMAAGFAIVGVTAFLCAHLTATWSPHTYLPYAVLFAIGESFAMLGLVGSIVLHMIGTGAVSVFGKPQRPAQVLTFSAFLHTVRIMGGQIGTVLVLHLVNERTKFHANILEQQTALARLPISTFLRGAAFAFGNVTGGPSHATALTGYLLGATVRQQASTLAFADAFSAMAWASIAALLLTVFVRLSIPSLDELA